MKWLSGFRLGKEKKEEPRVVGSLLTLTRANYDYTVGVNVFRNFTYTFDVNLSGNQENRVLQSKTGVEKLVELFDTKYPVDKGFKRHQKGELSSDTRKIEISYYCPHGFMPKNLGSINFSVQYDSDSISRSYALVFLYGLDQTDLLSNHDSVIGLSNIVISPDSLRTLSQIDAIRKGNGPKVENFLLT
jgi:hypothetical protein